MGTLNKYLNAAAVEEALDKGVAAYIQAEENKTDILSVSEEINVLRSNDTKNLFDSSRLLEIEGCAVENGEYLFQAIKAYGHGVFDISCKPNTLYTVSLYAKTIDGTEDSNGLVVKMKQSDGTGNSIALPNNTTEWTKIVLTSKPNNEQVSGIEFRYENKGVNHWVVKDLQFEEGKVATDYVPHYTACDYSARERITTLEEQMTINFDAIDSIGLVIEKNPTKNLFDTSFLAEKDGFTVQGSEIISTAVNFMGLRELPISFESGTYTISFYAKCEGNVSTTGNGLFIKMNYSDGKNVTVQIPNNTAEFTKIVLKSDGREITSVQFGYNNGTANIWHVKEMQIETGSTATEYVPPVIVTANDKVVRKKLNELDTLLKASSWEAEGRIREKQLRQVYLDSNKSPHWYGVQWAEESNPDNVVAINSENDDSLHAILPIQSKMRRCVIQDGIVNYYLDADNSELKEDGTLANLDGTDGNVMVEIPEFFYRCEEEMINGIRTIRLKISEQGLPGFVFSRKRYTSAYEATIDRENEVLASVCTTLFTRGNGEVKSEANGKYVVGDAYSYGTQKTAERSGFTANATKYRGGVNDSSLDSETNKTSQNYARNQLGLPIANVNRTMCRNFADVDNDIFMEQYDTLKTLWILAQVEFKTRHIQKPISEGGLGTGATVYPDYHAYEAFFSPQGGISCIPCGVTNVLGNNSGEVYYKMVNVPVESTGSKDTIVYTRFADLWMPVMSYRGIENFYGHLYSIADQITIKVTPTNVYYDGHEDDKYWRYSDVAYYYEPNPYLTNDETNTDKLIGTYNFMCNTRTVTSLMLGKYAHILHTDTTEHKKDDYSNYYCDCCEILGSGAGYMTMNGRIVSSELVGFHFIVTQGKFDNLRPSDGTRINMF